MIKPFALASLVLVATPVFADARLDEFVAVFQAHNCVLATKGEDGIPEKELMALFAHAGFSEEDVAYYASSLLENEQASVERETDAVTILSPLCVVETSE